VNVADFDYTLPEDLIAQEPLPERDASRLLVLDRSSGALEHRLFRDLPGLLRAGDLLVLNDTRVVPARLEGRRATGGLVEALALERVGGSDEAPEWECLTRSSKPLRAGARIDFGCGLSAVAIGRSAERSVLRFEDARGMPVEALLERGSVPLPPYIERLPGDPRAALDRDRYQTVFARTPGAVAAPTAGLHFTPRILEEIRAGGVDTAFVTLHTGIGTFLPVRVEAVADHRMHPERFEIPESAAHAVRRARERGGRVVAVGTTVVRTLESRADAERGVAAGSGRCDLFIYPGHAFRVVDALLTNFHLPRSTLLMLVCAFAGRQNVLAAYEEAIATGYRFYSYGDAMWIG